MKKNRIDNYQQIQKQCKSLKSMSKMKTIQKKQQLIKPKQEGKDRKIKLKRKIFWQNIRIFKKVSRKIIMIHKVIFHLKKINLVNHKFRPFQMFKMRMMVKNLMLGCLALSSKPKNKTNKCKYLNLNFQIIILNIE